MARSARTVGELIKALADLPHDAPVTGHDPASGGLTIVPRTTGKVLVTADRQPNK